jgi:hypothetical protein
VSPWLVVALWYISGHCLVRESLFSVGSLWMEIRSLYRVTFGCLQSSLSHRRLMLLLFGSVNVS